MNRRAVAAAAILIAMVAASPVVARRLAGFHVQVPFGGIRGEPVRVYYPPDPFQPLNIRFAWTQVEAARHDDRDAWVAYECRSVFPPTRTYGTEPPAVARRSVKGVVLHSTRNRSRSPHAPDIVVLLRLRAAPGDRWSVVSAAARTPSLEIDPDHLPVYWIGTADEQESIALLDWLGRTAASPEAREKLVSVIGVHRDSAATVAHLTGLLSSDLPANVRSAAEAGLGWHSPPATIGRLTGPAPSKDAGR